MPGRANLRNIMIPGSRRCSLGQVSGGEALLEAISKGKIHLARFILEAVDDCSEVVNAKDIHGKTPLIRACKIREQRARSKAVELLITKGANVNLRDNMGRTALSYACEVGANDVVRLLVKNNGDPDISDNDGCSALIYSAQVGNDVAIDIITKSFRRLGLNVDKDNSDGMTALMIAAKNGFLECATILAVEGRASVTKRDSVRNMTAEQWARENGCTTPELEPFSESAAGFAHKRSRSTRAMSVYAGYGSQDDDTGAAGCSQTIPNRRSSTTSIDSHQIDNSTRNADENRAQPRRCRDASLEEVSKRLNDLKIDNAILTNRLYLQKRASCPVALPCSAIITSTLDTKATHIVSSAPSVILPVYTTANTTRALGSIDMKQRRPKPSPIQVVSPTDAMPVLTISTRPRVTHRNSSTGSIPSPDQVQSNQSVYSTSCIDFDIDHDLSRYKTIGSTLGESVDEEDDTLPALDPSSGTISRIGLS